MKNLPSSAKWLIGLLLFSIITMSIAILSKSSTVQDAYSLKDLEYLQVENPNEVLKKYKSFDNKEEADYYIQDIIGKSALTFNKEEEKLFKDKEINQAIFAKGVNFTETKLYINYNKFETSEEEFDYLKQYINNKNSYDIGVFMTTDSLRVLYSKILYTDLLSKNEVEVDYDYDFVNLPLAYLVIDGVLVKEYESFKDLELK